VRGPHQTPERIDEPDEERIVRGGNDGHVERHVGPVQRFLVLRFLIEAEGLPRFSVLFAVFGPALAYGGGLLCGVGILLMLREGAAPQYINESENRQHVVKGVGMSAWRSVGSGCRFRVRLSPLLRRRT
jgi:hypothetical protein